MGLTIITYCGKLLLNIAFFSDGFAYLSFLDSSSSPYPFILYGAIIIAVVYFLVMSQTRSLVKTKKLLKEKELDLKIIENQKNQLEYRDKNMTDSLIYAQRIQEALLPSETYFRNFIENSFIYFKPKDIVSGDFYWIGEKGNKVFIVAADCTGHGVPGALMSMIGLEIVQRAFNDGVIQSSSQILNLLNKDLEKIFSREKNIGTIIRDGMDIGLCIIDMENRKMQYSGAFFPLYMVRNGSLTEIKCDKLVIGMNPEGAPYTNHELDLLEDDVFYLFSDGYVDQFGGSQNKKFMYRRFRYLLLTIHRFPFYDQKAILEDNIRTWMGPNTQVDDMMVLGFRPFPAAN
jgi:serine phosphatase RsbU (regulator of sigma subunit)